MKKEVFLKKAAMISFFVLIGVLYAAFSFMHIYVIGQNNPAARESMPELYAIVDMAIPMIFKMLSIFK